MKKKPSTRSETPVEPTAPAVDPGPQPLKRSPEVSFPIVGIGASAGGLEAFTQLLKALPPDTGMAFVLVQHLDPDHESALTQILSRTTSLPVSDVANNQSVEPNHVYIIPPDTILSIADGLLKLQPRLKNRTPHRPIDVFFESLALDHAERAIGVVLSGTASDGTLGLEAIKVAGGITFAQDSSAKYDSMPRSAVAAGCVDLVLSPEEIALEIARIAKHPYVSGQPLTFSDRTSEDLENATAHQDNDTPAISGSDPSPFTDAASSHVHGKVEEETNTSERGEDGYAKTLSILRSHSGVDFSLYKSSTIQRRITRRLVINKQNTLEDYAAFLRGNVKELDALCSDVLISVTTFFRNPEAFEALQRLVLPELLRQPGDDPVRVWVPGCSTGQEAYSIAIAFMELAEKSTRGRNLQVFATDLNEALLDRARAGLYPRSLSDEISPERLRRFFVEEQGGYRVSKSLREIVVFARQNLLADPPFSRMDLISCRNVLIYLGPNLQKKALPTFHYALKAGGFLFLGASESIGGFGELFEPVDKKSRIYSKKSAPTPAFHMPAGRGHGARTLPGRRATAFPAAQPQGMGAHSGELNAQREADRITVQQFAPPGVLVDAELQVLQFRGSTGAFLEPPVGKASFNLLKMVREGLMLPLSAAFKDAKTGNKATRRENVRVKQNGETRAVNLEVIPLKNLPEPCFLILFEDAETAVRAPVRSQPAGPPLSKEAEAGRISELEADLSEMREYLLAIQEQHEATNEELQAASEEVQSANEELQSINEELETSKEELESANEELTTVNEEMAHRNSELTGLNNDLVNFQNSTRLVVLLLARDLTIRRFSPQAEKQFELRATDVGRPVSHIRHNLVLADDAQTPLDLEAVCVEVIASVSEKECEVLDSAGHWHSLRARPYMTLDKNVDGAVLLLLEIDQLKQSEQAIAAARDYAVNTVETVREPLVVLDSDLRVESANRSFYREFQVDPAQTVGTFIYDLGNHQWDIPRLRTLLEEILPQSKTVEDFEVEHDFEQLGRRTMLLNARTILNRQQKTERILLAIEDITDRKQAELALQASNARFEAVFNVSPVGMYLVDATFHIRMVSQQARPIFGDIGELIGRDFVEVIHILWPPQCADDIVRRFQQTLETGEPYTISGFSEVRLDRTVREYYDWQVHRIGLPDGEYGMICYFVDISGRVLAEERLNASETLYRRLFETAKDGVLILDADSGRILEANPFMTELSGYPTADFIGKELWEIGLFRDKAANEAAFRELQQQGYVRYDHLPLKSRSSEPVEVEFVSNIYQWDHRRVAQCNIRDISDRSRLEKQTRKQAAELSDLHRRKDEFLAMLSHELRSPLAPIANAVELLGLQQGTETLIQQQARSIIERQMKQLQRLVDDLLEVSRITTGRVQLRRERVVVSRIVEGAVETVRPLIEQRFHELTVSVPPDPIWLHADVARLEQVLANLLTNAAKYTSEGGHIWVTVQQEADECVLRVRDTGAGISPELLPHIFDLFTQAERSLDRSQGGLGIGLALVQRLTQLHGGAVDAESEPGQGSEFIVRLPIAPQEGAQPALPTSEHAEAASRPLRVLVVDDNVDTVLSFTMLLRASGHDVRTAYDGLTAVQAALDYQPDVVLLDIGLPVLNGYEVAKRIRQESTLRNVVLIALTGYGQETDRQEALQSGFNHHLVKPARLEQLQKILTTVSERVT